MEQFVAENAGLIVTAGGVVLLLLAWFLSRLVRQTDEAVKELRATCEKLGAMQGSGAAELRQTIEQVEADTLRTVVGLREFIAEKYVSRLEFEDTKRSLREMNGKLDRLIEGLLTDRRGRQ